MKSPFQVIHYLSLSLLFLLCACSGGKHPLSPPSGMEIDPSMTLELTAVAEGLSLTSSASGYSSSNGSFEGEGMLAMTGNQKDADRFMRAYQSALRKELNSRGITIDHVALAGYQYGKPTNDNGDPTTQTGFFCRYQHEGWTGLLRISSFQRPDGVTQIDTFVYGHD